MADTIDVGPTENLPSRLLTSARPKQVAIVQNYLSQLTEAEAEAVKALSAKL